MLESVGLTPQAERVYAAMVRRPVAGVAALADELELSASEVQDAVHLLIERALIVPAGDGAWRAVGPQAALSALLAEQEAELANRHLRLETVRAWAAALEAEHDLGRPVTSWSAWKAPPPCGNGSTWWRTPYGRSA
ncbi:hypothetical protein ACFQZ4_06625 [Catellatospora coxensis]